MQIAVLDNTSSPDNLQKAIIISFLSLTTSLIVDKVKNFISMERYSKISLGGTMITEQLEAVMLKG